jgi:predicted RNA-binding Zn-ribbon protein involved in translation (DUF1610 family)
MPDPMNRDRPTSGLIHEQPLIETGGFAGWYRCWRRVITCKSCGHHYVAEEYELWECPDCGSDRHCSVPVRAKGSACRVHGGASLKGMDSAQFIHGGYSKYWEPTWQRRYDEFMQDPDRLAVEHEMATIRTLLAQEIEELEEGGTATQWRQAMAFFENARRAFEAKNYKGFAQQFAQLGLVLNDGTDRRERMAEIRRLAEQERKLVDTQRQILVDMGEFVTRGVALRILQNLLEVVKDNVLPLEGGPTAIGQIAAALERLVGPMGGGRIAKRGESPQLPERVAD